MLLVLGAGDGVEVLAEGFLGEDAREMAVGAGGGVGGAGGVSGGWNKPPGSFTLVPRKVQLGMTLPSPPPAMDILYPL